MLTSSKRDSQLSPHDRMTFGRGTPALFPRTERPDRQLRITKPSFSLDSEYSYTVNCKSVAPRLPAVAVNCCHAPPMKPLDLTRANREPRSHCGEQLCRIGSGYLTRVSSLLCHHTPDDETLGAGGLIHGWARRELPIVIISVTDGEAACPEVAGLADVRQAELRRALATLGAPRARIVRLQIPDGRISEHRALLADTLRSIVRPNATIVAPVRT